MFFLKDMRVMRGVFCIGALFAFSTAVHAGDFRHTGTVYLRDGTQIDATDISCKGLNEERGSFSAKIDGKSYMLKYEDLSSLSFLRIVDRFVRKKENRGQLVGNDHIILVSLKNGNEAHASNISIYTHCYLTYLDGFTGESVRQFFRVDGSGDEGNDTPEDAKEIVRIDLASSGTMKWSETSQTYFPPTYSFDPYTGGALSAAVPKK